MKHIIEISYKDNIRDPEGEEALSRARLLGIGAIDSVSSVRVIMLHGRLNESEAGILADRLFTDPLLQRYRLNPEQVLRRRLGESGADHCIEVMLKQGVMDPVSETILKGAADLGLGDKIEAVRTAWKYMLAGDLQMHEMEKLAGMALANRTIEDIFIDRPDPDYSLKTPAYCFKLHTISLCGADSEELERISSDGMLSLSLEEMKSIQTHFQKTGRDPTDLELEILAQTWSEHCVHKTLKGNVDYEGPAPSGWERYIDASGRLVIENLLKSTVMRATEELDKNWCLSVFKDNAGVIAFDDENALCFKVETHNHPSAIEPYGGAGTGIGGVIRDTLGAGLGAMPIMNTDVFCLGLPDMKEEEVPAGAMHPRRVLRGVVCGVRDYGNRMGIPTANGAVYFDERYTGNCLVFCGSLGLLPRSKIEKKPECGDFILVAGGRTGRDGIHGATFSSARLHSDSEEVAGGAVQIGNPIMEKKLADTILQARDLDLFNCITDCGAGGLSSAVGEMAAQLGAEVEIDKVPLKYEGLSYCEIWISEAQERMVLSVPPENLESILEVFAAEDVEASAIGRFTGDSTLRLRFKGHLVAELDMKFLHDGLPAFNGKAYWSPPQHPDPLLDVPNEGGRAVPRAHATGEPQDLDVLLKNILAAPNVRSKEWIIRQYDHEVQGRSVVKPLVGVECDGPGDAAVITPVLGSPRGVAVSCGMNPGYADLDPYHFAAGAIDEALRNITAVGGDPSRAALLDNFCWANARRPEQLGALVRASMACYDCAIAFKTPFISGKDSLNNEFNIGSETISIPPTLLISAVSPVDDISFAQTMDLKESDNPLYIVGNTYPELGGSHYYAQMGLKGRSVPKVRGDAARESMYTLHRAITAGMVRACHDLSEGGVAVAAAEMAFAGNLGASLDLREMPYSGLQHLCSDEVMLFSESNSRFLVEVDMAQAEQFERKLSAVPCSKIGKTDASGILSIIGLNGGIILKTPIEELKMAWQTPLFE